MSETKTRPEYVTDEHLAFLDNLRESGAMNMFGAAQMLPEYEDDKPLARKILKYWMDTFGQAAR